MSEPQISPRILELLVSHICHDLVSPVGAINNGIEFIEEMGDSATPDAMALIGSSVSQASTALQCFRMAYGGAGSGANVTFEEIKTTFANYIEGGRTRFQWQINPMGGSMPPAGFMKVLLNAMIMARECIPADGDLTVESLESGDGVKITSTAKKVEFREGVGAAFRGEADLDDLTPRSVHGYLTAVFADYFGIEIEMEKVSEGEMVFTLQY
jgi:histidine phosphotransferase ChpT